MTTDTEALRRAFEAYINPDADVNLHWLAAGYYAGHGVQQSWLDFQAGYAAAKAETAAAVAGRWYFVTNDGAATLCVDEADARESAAEADIAFPRMAPHRAVQLVPADQLAAAVAANSSEHAHAMAVLRQIADMPRRTREQRLASACVRFLDAIRAGAKEPSDA